jgi:hypothetical protein
VGSVVMTSRTTKHPERHTFGEVTANVSIAGN